MKDVIEQLIEELVQFLEHEQVTKNVAVCDLHSKDESYHTPSSPDLVVFPKTTEEVSRIVKLANQYRVPVVPFGVGTSLEGHIIPYDHGMTVDFSQMNQIIEVHPADMLVTVQPGVTRTELNKELKKHGLFFSVDPGADATLGGMAATNASGTTSVKYGVMRDQVRDLEVVLADGTVIHTGNRAAKSSSGYHLNGLFVGSEGTLGCFTELTLRVFGIPEVTVAARATFTSITNAIEAVPAVLQAGIPIARVELVDTESIRQVNAYSETDYTELPTLFLEFHGNEAGLAQDVAFTEEIVEDFGCVEILFEKETASRNRLWEARHNAAYAYTHGFPGKQMMLTDVCVPISELAEAVVYARDALDRDGLEGGIVGHVGDGNFHVLLMIDHENKDELECANQYNEMIVRRALHCGGTCTGEHGVGVGKQKYQRDEHGAAYDVMLKIKQVLDPENILNPGKLIK